MNGKENADDPPVGIGNGEIDGLFPFNHEKGIGTLWVNFPWEAAYLLNETFDNAKMTRFHRFMQRRSSRSVVHCRLGSVGNQQIKDLVGSKFRS